MSLFVRQLGIVAILVCLSVSVVGPRFKSLEDGFVSQPLYAQANVNQQQSNVDGGSSNPFQVGNTIPREFLAGLGCAVPQWLENESKALDDYVLRVHRKYGIDVARYQKESPTECALQQFKYRLRVLGLLVAYIEKQ